MKFAFAQVYPEVGADFDLPGPLLSALRLQLEAQRWNIGAFQERFNRDWTLVLLVSAKRDSELEVKGPTYVRKHPEVEFVIYVPYLHHQDFVKKVRYVFGALRDGLKVLFARYDSDLPGVDKVFDELLEAVRSNPKDFQYQ
jgi:hypothetical protein